MLTALECFVLSKTIFDGMNSHSPGLIDVTYARQSYAGSAVLTGYSLLASLWRTILWILPHLGAESV